MAVAISAHSILASMEPTVLKQFLSGEISMGPGMLFLMALFWFIPLVMAFLSVTLKDEANRRVNLVMGGIFIILNIAHLIEHLAQPSAHQLLIIGSTVVVATLIVWYAGKWPKEEI